MDAAVITTYRCFQKCAMCHIWKFPTREEEEFAPSLLEKLPRFSFCNVTGGEPFLRKDLTEIVTVLKRKARRIVISTNGYLTDDILKLARHHREIGFRISLEGMPAVNDALRGMPESFDHGLRTLLGLQELGLKDIGFGITVSDRNHAEMLKLYHLAKRLNVEFATAVVHNSFYFHTLENELRDKEKVAGSFQDLVGELLRSKKIKDWYRAYFNYGLIGYIQGHERLLPCPAGTEVFFLDPRGEIYPCNGMEEKVWLESLGNLHQHSFKDIWSSQKATEARAKVRSCPKNCWMIGTVSPAMKRSLWKPTLWIFKNKFARHRQGNS
jgi:radical SAM protein with 4Fe4S-binding SPASM domain